jgi:hypothetical protein
MIGTTSAAQSRSASRSSMSLSDQLLRATPLAVTTPSQRLVCEVEGSVNRSRLDPISVLQVLALMSPVKNEDVIVRPARRMASS